MIEILLSFIFSMGWWFGISPPEPMLDFGVAPRVFRITQGGTQTATTPTDGQFLIGKTDGSYNVNTLTAGSNVTITEGDGTISIAASAGGINDWQVDNGDLTPTTTIGLVLPSNATTTGWFNIGAVNGISELLNAGDLFVSGNATTSLNFVFMGELLPDGDECSVGQILKKAGANDWDCAADDSGGGLAEDELQIVTVSLSAANIIAMFATPIQVIAAPGVGKVIIIDKVLVAFTYNSTQFTGGGIVKIVEETSSTQVVGDLMLAAEIQGTADVNKMNPSGGGVVLVANKAMQITNLTAAFADGNSTMKIFIDYRIITL